MGQPHKHAQLIKAWADGAEIQYKFKDKWHDYEGEVNWSIVDMEYRIKPKTIRYRNYLWKFEPVKPYGMCMSVAFDQKIEETDRSFIRWVGDWQEVEL